MPNAATLLRASVASTLILAGCSDSIGPGDPITALPRELTVINAWVEQNTEGFIDSILDSLDPALVMVLINAIYFDGAWTTRFDPADTRRQPFQQADGSTVDVDMMSLPPQTRNPTTATACSDVPPWRVRQASPIRQRT